MDGGTEPVSADDPVLTAPPQEDWREKDEG